MIHAIRNARGQWLKRMSRAGMPVWVDKLKDARHFPTAGGGKGVVTRMTTLFPNVGVISLVPLDLVAGPPIIEIDPDRACCDCSESYRCDLADKNDCPVFCPKCRKK